MARYELVIPSEAARIRAWRDVGKSLSDIRRLSRRSRWTIQRILSNEHPVCALLASDSSAANDICDLLAPNSSHKADSIAPSIQVGSKSEDGTMIVAPELIVAKFYDEIVVHFPLGRTRPKEKFVAGLVAALIADRVTEPVLKEAALVAIRSHKGRFPAVSLCRQFCVEARAKLRGAGLEDSASTSEFASMRGQTS
jgi:hypothetical protein